jgi:hypothetical protein
MTANSLPPGRLAISLVAPAPAIRPASLRTCVRCAVATHWTTIEGSNSFWAREGASGAARAASLPVSTASYWDRLGRPPRGVWESSYRGWRPPDGRVYCYLLGLYLGDGCIIERRASRQLVLTLDAAYRAIIDEAASAIATVFPGIRVHRADRAGCVALLASHPALPQAFPSMAPGASTFGAIGRDGWPMTLRSRSCAASCTPTAAGASTASGPSYRADACATTATRATSSPTTPRTSGGSSASTATSSASAGPDRASRTSRSLTATRSRCSTGSSGRSARRCGREDSNLHGPKGPPGPKPGASAKFRHVRGASR